MGVTRGDPSLLAGYTDATVARVARSRAATNEYRAAIRRLLAAPSDLPVPIVDRSGELAADLDDLERLDRQPARFAAALLLADQLARFPWVGGRPLEASPPVDPAAARALATELAVDLEAATRDGWFDPALLARVERAVPVPELAVALVDELGPEGLLAFPAALEVRYRSLTTGTVWDPDRPPHTFLEDGERVIDSLGRALALASQHGLPSSFADEVVAAATQVQGHAVGLSLYLGRGGRFDGRFAVRVAEGLYEAERSSGVSPFWRPLADDAHGQVPWFFGSDHWFDPLASAARALSHHPLAAQDFLLGDDVGAERDRLSYLTAERTWRADQGAGFGALIEAATTVHRDHDGDRSPGYRSALLASRFLHELPFHEGGWRLLRSDDPGYHLYPALVPTVGRVLAVYVADVQATPLGRADHASAGAVWTEGRAFQSAASVAHGIVLSPARLPLLLEAVAGDDGAFNELVTAQHVLARQQLDHVASQLGTEDDAVVRERLNSVLTRISALAGATLHAGNLVEIGDGAATDARVARLAGLADTGLGLAMPGGPVTKAALGQVTSAVTGEFDGTGAEASARWEATTAVTVQHRALIDLTHAVLLDHGWYAPGGPLEAHRPEGLRFVGDDGDLVPRVALDEVGVQQLDNWTDLAGTSDLRTTITTYLTRGMNGQYR
jgi:hypothetical protein